MRAIELYERSCNAGMGLGCARLGEMYANGYGVDSDRVKARAYRNRAHEKWLAACLGGEPRWCPDAASSTREGEPTAHELNQRACDHGVSDGCIAVLHDQLTHAVGSPDATMRTLDQGCSRGESAACAKLALGTPAGCAGRTSHSSTSNSSASRSSWIQLGTEMPNTQACRD